MLGAGQDLFFVFVFFLNVGIKLGLGIFLMLAKKNSDIS